MESSQEPFFKDFNQRGSTQFRSSLFTSNFIDFNMSLLKKTFTYFST